MWRVIFVSLLAQCYAGGQNSYDGTSSYLQSSSSSNQQQQQWSWQENSGEDLLPAATTVDDSFHPVSFTSPSDSQKLQQTSQNTNTAYQQQYNANVQQDNSGVAQAFEGLQSVRNAFHYYYIYRFWGYNDICK